MAFTYPSSAGGSGTVADPSVKQIDPNAPALYYKSNGAAGSTTSNLAYKESYVTPIAFDRDMTVTRIALRMTSIPSTGTLPNGTDVWMYIYEGLDTTGGNVPKTLLSNAGIVNLSNTGVAPNVSSQTAVKVLPTPLTFEANKIYWIGASLGISNGAGGASQGTTGNYRTLNDAGSSTTANNGVLLSDIPLAHTGFSSYYIEDIALAPVWGTAPSTLGTNIYPQANAPLVWVEGEPV